ncbi:D-alanine--D-alanine ligase [Vaginella massiliensis]|uniref:D-alanine--D-alanine ligase n=1 Tax=Vaginella massiliensis TaxID=1816680 RepID=UPI00083809BD|nr:D-alanine--D-alanine ligase [Vaginella massiliensis]
MLKVAVVAGGYSDESVISLKSCELIYQNIDQSKYEPIRVRILKEGWYAEIDGEKYPIHRGDFTFDRHGEKVKFDVVFNTIHGTPGEDGYLQAYFEMIGIKYNGCDFYQSAITFNKKDCIAVLSKYGIPHAQSVYVAANEQLNHDEVLAKVGLPCFVKPNKSGSSLGISKVHSKEELQPALDKAFREDREVLIESFLDGTEVSVGVLKYNGVTTVLGITEIISENEFFDYEAKYEGKSQEITPARLDTKTEQKVRNIAAKAYDALNMTGFSRSEYIVVNGEPYFLEMNTLPGMSPASIFPQQAQHAGISMKDLIESELNFALNKTSPWNV